MTRFREARALGQLERADLPLLVFCFVCVALGIALRAQSLGFPGGLTFDEHHFVENARNYLEGKADWNDHPPLGKLMMAVAIRALDDSAVAWRTAPLLCGLANIGLGFALARSCFQNTLAGVLAATFLAIDGFLVTYSRTALLDGMLVSFLLAAMLCVVVSRARPTLLLLAGGLVGCAMAIKFSGVTLLFPLGLATISYCRRVTTRKLLVSLVAWLLVPIVFLSWIRFGLHLSGAPDTWRDAANWVADIFRAHAGATDGKNPLVSSWYTWGLPTKPIVMRYDVVEPNWVRVMISLGNPLLWWSSAALVVGALLWLPWSEARKLVSRLRGRSSAEATQHEGTERETSPLVTGSLWLLSVHVAALSPWIITARDSYIYHYLPSYTFGLVFLAGWVARGLQRPRMRRPLLVALALVVAVSGYYAPVWAQLPLSTQALQVRPLFP